MFWPLAGLPGVEEVSQGLVINFNKARCKGELRTQKSPSLYCMTESLGANRANMLAVGNIQTAHSLQFLVCMILHTNLPSLCCKFLCCSEDLLHRSGNDASGLVVFSPLHGVCLSTSCLAVGKAAHIVAIQC